MSQRDIYDALASLRDVRAMREEAASNEGPAVSRARKLGLSWGAIGEALGRDRTSVWEKYRDQEENEQ